MDEGDEILLAFLKGLVGSAANLALPGLGGLVSVWFSRIKDENSTADPNEEISKELLVSFKAIAPSREAPGKRSPKRVRLPHPLKKRKMKNKKEEVGQLLDAEVKLNSLMGIAAKRIERSGMVSMADLPEREQREWATLGKAQLAMVSSPGFIPGVWQDEFAALLQGVCEKQLQENGSDRDHWRRLLGINDEKEPAPDYAQLNEQLRAVTRVFAARMEANPTLGPIAEQLRQSDRTAMQYALLERIDQQRQSLQLIAAALAAFAAALGIGIDVIE